MTEIEVRWSKDQDDTIEYRRKIDHAPWTCLSPDEALALGTFARSWSWYYAESSRRQLWRAQGFTIYADKETPGVFDAYGPDDTEPSTHATLEDAKRWCYAQDEGGR